MWISRETLWQLYNKDPEIKIIFLTVILLKIKLKALNQWKKMIVSLINYSFVWMEMSQLTSEYLSSKKPGWSVMFQNVVVFSTRDRYKRI